MWDLGSQTRIELGGPYCKVDFKHYITREVPAFSLAPWMSQRVAGV